MQLWKVELGLNSLTKMKRWRNFTHDSLLSTEKIVRYTVYCLSIWYNEKWFIYHFFKAQLKLNFSVKTSTHLLHNYTQRGENLRKMTSCLQLKNNFFLFLFRMINVYFVRERFELSIGIYISTKNIFHMKLASLKKMVKT